MHEQALVCVFEEMMEQRLEESSMSHLVLMDAQVWATIQSELTHACCYELNFWLQLQDSDFLEFFDFVTLLKELAEVFTKNTHPLPFL